MAAFFWKGGGWEPFEMNFEEFMAALFTRPELICAGGDGNLWDDALRQLEAVS